MTDVIVVGDGGREAALVNQLKWVARSVRQVPASTGSDELLSMTEGNHNHLYVIGPEQPLMEGLVDFLESMGRRVFGPVAEAALLEGSKDFMKVIVSRTPGVKTAPSMMVISLGEMNEAIERFGLPIVIKANGLAGGKGVTIADTKMEAIADADDKLSGAAFGEAGQILVVEKFLQGRELSVMALCDGHNAVILPRARDYKRLQDGDQGPNTGGMGAYAPVGGGPSEDELRTMVESILATLRDQNTTYRGVMYLGLMLTDDGPYVLEINARFGDPETQVVMPLIKPQELLDCMLDIANHEELSHSIEQLRGAAVAVTLAAQGYPDKPLTGDPVQGLMGAAERGCVVLPAGLDFSEDPPVTSGGRVLYVVATDTNAHRARVAAYKGVECIRFGGMQYRRDIGALP